MWCSGSFFALPLLRWATASSPTSAPTTAQSTATATATGTHHPQAPQAPSESTVVDRQPIPIPCVIPPPTATLTAASRSSQVASRIPAPASLSPIPCPPAFHCASPPSTLAGPNRTTVPGLAARRRRPLLTLPLTPLTSSSASISTSGSARLINRRPGPSSTTNRPLSQAILLSPLLLSSPKSPHSIIERESRLTPSDPRMLSLSPRPPAPTARRLGRSGQTRPSPTMFNDWDEWEDSTPLQPPRYGDHRGSRRMQSAEADTWWSGMVEMMERQGRDELSRPMSADGTRGGQVPPTYAVTVPVAGH